MLQRGRGFDLSPELGFLNNLFLFAQFFLLEVRDLIGRLLQGFEKPFLFLFLHFLRHFLPWLQVFVAQIRHVLGHVLVQFIGDCCVEASAGVEHKLLTLESLLIVD